MKAVNKMTAVLTASAVMFGGALATAPAALSAESSSVSTTQNTSGGLTHQEWLDVAKTAEANGDRPSAEAAYSMAAKADGISDRGLAGWTKSAIKAVLKYGKDKLPASIRPYADKIYNSLVKFDDWTETSIAMGLQQQGVDPNTATELARYAVTYINSFV